MAPVSGRACILWHWGPWTPPRGERTSSLLLRLSSNTSSQSADMLLLTRGGAGRVVAGTSALGRTLAKAVTEGPSLTRTAPPAAACQHTEGGENVIRTVW